MPASMPFQDTKTDGEGNALPVEKKEPEQAESPAKRGRRKKTSNGKRMFCIHAAEGCFICAEDELPKVLIGKTEIEVYLLDKKVKSLTVVPGKIDLLGGEKGADTVELTLD